MSSRRSRRKNFLRELWVSLCYPHCSYCFHLQDRAYLQNMSNRSWIHTMPGSKSYNNIKNVSSQLFYGSLAWLIVPPWRRRQCSTLRDKSVQCYQTTRHYVSMIPVRESQLNSHTDFAVHRVPLSEPDNCRSCCEVQRCCTWCGWCVYSKRLWVQHAATWKQRGNS